MMQPQHDTFPLSEAPLGRKMKIRHLRMTPETGVRLRELGISENVFIRCLHRGYGNVICQVLNTRIAVNVGLARWILVSPAETGVPTPVTGAPALSRPPSQSSPVE